MGDFARRRARLPVSLHVGGDSRADTAGDHRAMNSTRRLSLAALFVACLHLVFGAIVRISGSGLGCGENWPKCYGYWFPPFSRPDLVVEVSHRYLASILTLTVLAMAFVAFRNRAVTGGRGGPMRAAFGAVAAVFAAAI